MSLSIGPLTAPLARTCCAPASGAMTRMNDDSPTRFLECTAPTWPAPPLARQPSADETAGQGGGDPERQRPGADRRSWHDEGMRIARRPRQRDAHLEMARAGARAVRAGREML